MAEQDPWARWVIETRFGGDETYAAEALRLLYAIRDKVLDHAQVREGETLLDVGAGDGLIAFGALERVGPTGRVILSDISQPLLDHARALAEQMGVADRCSFVRAAAEDLRPIADGSVDVVTTRSVLIYVADKAAAFRAFHRVLRPGGRISLFEPINRYGLSDRSDTRLWGYDLTPVADLVRRIRAFYRQHQPDETDPMLNFDERDLLRYSEAAGFAEIHLELRVDLQPPTWPPSWEVAMRAPPNPRVPALGEVIAQVLTPEEAAHFEAHLRPLIEARQGRQCQAVAYLWAVKG